MATRNRTAPGSQIQTVSIRLACAPQAAELILAKSNVTRLATMIGESVMPMPTRHPLPTEKALTPAPIGDTAIAFTIDGGKKEAFRFGRALKLIDISNNLGDAKSLITHPATTTHQRLTPEARLAAIVDFTFNLGAGRLQTSTLRRRVNQRDWVGAASELRRWVYGGGRVLPGLVARREAECRLIF